MATATQRAEDVDVIKGADEVSLPQKMLSAVSGSILTSLLGMYSYAMLSLFTRHSNSQLLSNTVVASALYESGH
jgi:hypothetical protein